MDSTSIKQQPEAVAAGGTTSTAAMPTAPAATGQAPRPQKPAEPPFVPFGANLPPPTKSPYNSALNVVGRFLLASVFLTAGATKFFAAQPKTADPAVLRQAMEPVLQGLHTFNKYAGTHYTIPQSKYKQFVMGIGVVEGLGGFLFVQNHKIGGVVLVLWSALMTALSHQFWTEEPESDEFHNQLQHFLKNVAIIGGLLSFIATTDGVPLQTKRKAQLDELDRILKRGGRMD